MEARSRKFSHPEPAAKPDHYSDHYLERKIRTGNRRACHWARWLAPRASQAAGLLLEAEVEAVVSAARLTTRQRQVVDLILEGLPERDIAERIGCSRSYAHQVRKAALTKLAAVYASCPLAGLFDVYLSETRRTGKPRTP